MRNRTACRPAHRRNAPPLAAGPTGRGGTRELTIAFGPGDLTEVRERVTAYGHGVIFGDRLEDLVLVVHELAANVIRHGGGHGSLQLEGDGDRIVCRVSDSGPGLSSVVATEPPSARNAGGRGLLIARRLSDLRIDSGPRGTTVTAVLPVN